MTMKFVVRYVKLAMKVIVRDDNYQTNLLSDVS